MNLELMVKIQVFTARNLELLFLAQSSRCKSINPVSIFSSVKQRWFLVFLAYRASERSNQIDVQDSSKMEGGGERRRREEEENNSFKTSWFIQNYNPRVCTDFDLVCILKQQRLVLMKSDSHRISSFSCLILHDSQIHVWFVFCF